MKFAYLILVHKNPKQLARLVSRLNTKDALVFIHIDKKVSEEVFEKEIRKLHIKNIHFVKDRKSIVWGGFNMVKAMISGLKELAASEEEIFARYPIEWAGLSNKANRGVPPILTTASKQNVCTI